VPTLPPLPRPRWVRPPLLDLGIAAFFVVLTVAEIASSTDDRAGWQQALAVSALVGLAWRRVAPLTVAVVLVVSDLLTNPDNQFSTLLALVVVAYTVGFETRPPRSWVGLAALVVPFVGVSLAGDLEPSDLAAAGVFLLGPWFVGVATSRRAERAATAMARAELLEREQQQREAEAVADERARIARELHDVVSHSLTVVTIQLQAVRRRLDAAQAQEAADLSAAETVTREAMGEMRRLLGVLRAGPEDASLAPQPGLDELPRLVERTDGPTTRVSLRVDGEPTPLSPGMDLAVYRVAQEALTNATRHSGAARVDVGLTWSPESVSLVVRDDGRGSADTHGDGSGHGLVGMRERAALYGGDVHVTTAPGAGFTVRASFPLGVRS
jgi:signal transduction histidine kinase